MSNYSSDPIRQQYDRDYHEPLDGFGEIFTVDEWNKCVKDGLFCNWDGHGYWVKEDLISRSEVFSTPQLDATHVIWYNK